MDSETARTESSSEGASAKLPKKTLFFYGLSEMPIQIAQVPVTAYVLNFYVQDLGLSAALVGAAYLISRLFDVVTDPLVGYLSDRTTTRWGRRRVWMLASVPVMWIGAYMVFFPDPPVSIWYFLSWMAVLWLGWTMLLIPYYAWAAELSPEYNERSLITGWRTALGLVANIVSKLIPAIALICCAIGGTPAVVNMIGIVLLVVLPLSVGLTVTNVTERRDFIPAQMPILAGLRVMWRNGPFKRLVTAIFINYTGTAIATSTMIFYIRGVLGEEEGAILALLAFYTTNLCSIPFWLWISKRIGKHRAWIAGLLTFTFVAPLYLLLGPGDFYWMLPIIAVTGFAGGTFHTMTNSMKADVIDLDTLRSGENRAAMFFAVWSMAMKLALAMGPFIALSTLGLLGFDSKPGIVHDPQQIWALKIVYALSTAVFFTIAAAVAWRYPITEERHLRLRKVLERRQARRLAAR